MESDGQASSWQGYIYGYLKTVFFNYAVLAIFNEADELKGIFGIPPTVKGKKLRSDPKFVVHTDLFIDTFDFVISHLDDIGLVTENAEQLGRLIC